MARTWIGLGDRGPGVRRWQELLLKAGYELPDWGADGGFGNETRDATIKAQTDLKAAGLYTGRIDCKVGDLTLEAMHKHLGLKSPGSDRVKVIDGVEVHDCRGHVDLPSGARPQWGDQWYRRRGVVMHRTSVRMGERPERYYSMNAHIAVTLQGRIFLIHPWGTHIWHGHRPSIWTIGIEFDGNPEGWPPEPGKKSYYWKPGGGPDPITDAQVKAGDVLLRLLLDEFQAHDRAFRYIYAHRQSSNMRETDPGWEAWRKIAIPWMERTGATPGDIGRQGTTFGSGYHIPQSWDPSSPVKGFRVS